MSGLGNVNAFLAYLISDPSSPIQFGVGPLIRLSDGDRRCPWLGHLGGGSGGRVLQREIAQGAVRRIGDLSDLVSGDDDVSQMALQPFYMFQLGKGTYLRGAPVWVFNLENDTYSVPFGLGIGQVIKNDKTVYNIFIEPQWTILHDGVGQPEFTIFAGLNIQFLGK